MKQSVSLDSKGKIYRQWTYVLFFVRGLKQMEVRALELSFLLFQSLHCCWQVFSWCLFCALILLIFSSALQKSVLATIPTMGKNTFCSLWEVSFGVRLGWINMGKPAPELGLLVLPFLTLGFGASQWQT